MPATTPMPARPGFSNYARAMEHLLGVVQQLGFAQDMSTLIRMVLREARFLTGADGSAFVLRAGEDCCFLDDDAPAPLTKGSRFPMNDCGAGWVMHKQTGVSVVDIQGNTAIPVEMYRSTFVRGLAIVPIRAAKPVGAVEVYWSKPHRATEDEMKLLQGIADGAAAAMNAVTLQLELQQNAQARSVELEAAQQEIAELSLRDELTGLCNRRGFSILAEQQLRMTARIHAVPWLLCACIDGLKPINEGLGRQAGDKLLQTAAKVLRDAFRGQDVLARVGGNEFAVFGISQALPDYFDDRLQLYIDAYNASSAETVALSMTACLVHGEPSERATFEDLWVRAEQGLRKKQDARQTRKAAKSQA